MKIRTRLTVLYAGALFLAGALLIGLIYFYLEQSLDHRPGAALQATIRDFAEHFIGGYRSRYLPVVNSVRLAFGASLSVLIALVVGYRFIGFAAAWLWIGLTRLIGPLDLDSWQVIANAIAFFAAPSTQFITGQTLFVDGGKSLGGLGI